MKLKAGSLKTLITFSQTHQDKKVEDPDNKIRNEKEILQLIPQKYTGSEEETTMNNYTNKIDNLKETEKILESISQSSYLNHEETDNMNQYQ